MVKVHVQSTAHVVTTVEPCTLLTLPPIDHENVGHINRVESKFTFNVELDPRASKLESTL